MTGTWIVLAIVDVAVTYACFMKGKKVMGWIGVVGVIPPLTFALVLVPIIGAITPAKRGSKWDRPPVDLPPPPANAWRYTPSETARSTSQPTPGEPASTPAEAFVAGTRDLPSPTRPTEPSDVTLPSTHAAAIRAFLKNAASEGVIDGPTHIALVRHLEAPQEQAAPATVSPAAPPPVRTKPMSPLPPPPPPPAVAAPDPTPSPPRQTAPTPTAPASGRMPPATPVPPRAPMPAPAQASRSAAASATRAVPAPKPSPPKEPSRFSTRRDEMWEAFTSDVAVHGLAYLGVLLTFVSVLGFLLFAFKDLPIPAKPFVELFIVLTFFGWAWLLHRQNATRVAQAMEILGGMVLPLVWFAAIVDSAALPPDAEGDALVVALTVSSLAISGLYWLISRTYANSMLRFLVWPMVWTAAMGVGLVFKTDEYLIGDAITRLVAPQPALASVAIAASLGLLRWHKDAPLAAPTYTAALVGIPSAYLLTFGLSVGDGSALSWPIVVSGAGTIASVELVAHRYGWEVKLRSLRPYVYALVGVPLVLAIGLGWGGAIIAVTYVALAEIAIRSPRIRLRDVTSASAGAATGLALSLAEPMAAVVAFGVVSIWAHVRRRSATNNAQVAWSLNVVAAIAPAGLLFGLSALTAWPTAILAGSGLVLAGAMALKVLNRADDFDAIWWPAAATALGIGAAILWSVDGTGAAVTVASLGMSAAAVALGQRWPTTNLWLSSLLATIAVAIALETLGASGAITALTWSSIGIVTILASLSTHGATRLRIEPGHLTALGHVFGLFAFTASAEPLGFTVAITGWAIGWAISFAASEHQGGVVPLEIWSRTVSDDEGASATLADQLYAIVPTMSSLTATAAAIAIFIQATAIEDLQVGIGIVVALLAIAYASAARWLIRTDHGRMVFGWTAGILAVAGVALASTEPRAVIATALALVAARVTLLGVLPLVWLTWITWLVPAVTATALASELGLATESLAVMVLGIGSVQLLGALALDEIRSGARVTGEFTRSAWVLPPALIGAVLVPVGVAGLYVAGSSMSNWAASMAALTFAAASVMLRRSIWLTATLGSAALAVALGAAHVPAVESAAVWSVLGLVALASSVFVAKRFRDDVAGIGHAVGAVGLAYAFDETALVIALTAWASGWLAAVWMSERGGPSISRVIARSSSLAEGGNGSSVRSIAVALPPLLAVATSAAAALLLYSEFADFSEARAWTAAVIAGLGLMYAASTRYMLTSMPASTIFGWSAVILAATAVLVAIGEDMPIVVAATAFIAVRTLLIGSIDHTWLSWPAWMMPTVIVTALGHALGVPNGSLYLLTLATGATMMIGSLVADDVVNTRRAIGEGLRTPWMAYPFAIGLVIVPFSLAPIFALDSTTVGIASLAAALGYLLVAVLLRGGAITAPAIGLAALGTSLLLPESPMDSPWILVAMAALTTGWSFLAERTQSTESAASPWTRWDLAPLAMAHLVAGTAVLLTLDGSPDPVTWIAAGALSMVVGVWRHNRWSLDAGLLLIIVGSGFAGEPWLLIALVIGTARGMYGVWRDSGVERYVDHAIAVIALGAAWIDVALSLEWTYVEVVGFGSMTAGAVAVAAAGLSGLGLVKKDTFILWSGIGTAGVVAAVIAGFNARPTAVDGPWLAISIWLVAIASERWARMFHPNVRYATPAIGAFGWIVLLAGLGVSTNDAAISTAIVFGLVLVISVLAANRMVSMSTNDGTLHISLPARAWAIVSLAGMAISTAVAISEDSAELWLSLALGLALVAVATAIGEQALGIRRLRIATGAPALGALTAVLMALETSAFGIGIAMTIVAAFATLSTVLVVSRDSDVGWIESSLVTGLAATAITVPIALSALPNTQVAVLVLVAIGGQAISYGIAFNRDPMLAIGPPALGLAAIALVAESASGSALWFTVPVAVVLLAEADILHRMTAGDRDEERSGALLILEWSGVALLGLPPIVEMFTTDVAFGLVGFGFAVGLLMWALITRVKRRVLAAAVVATLSVMLTLAASAASSVPTNAGFWIIGGGIGFSIMLIAGFVEAYRSRSGTLMTRLGDLMEDWE